MIDLNFNTVECLELVRNHNPTNWKVDLTKPTVNLIAFRKLHQLSHASALKAMTEISRNPATKIYLMASYQYIMEGKVKEYHEVTQQIEQYNTQLMHLNGGPDSMERKEELRKHYRMKLSELDARRKELLSLREVKQALDAEDANNLTVSYEEA